MQDRRRQGKSGDVLDEAVDRALHALVQDLPPEERYALLRSLRGCLGNLLTTAPRTDVNPVEDMINRARLAAAFNVSLPGDESGPTVATVG
jgi:hypothetical protein